MPTARLLDVLVGMAGFYTLMALVVSALSEVLAALRQHRARVLQEAVSAMLFDPPDRGLVKAFYEHPLVVSLRHTGKHCMEEPRGFWERFVRWLRGGPPLPSYLPEQVVSHVLLDLLDERWGSPWPSPPPEGSGVRPELARVVTDFAREADGDRERLARRIAQWFKDVMDRTTGWYKRKSMVRTWLIAALAVGVLDADSLRLADALWTQGAGTAALVELGVDVARGEAPATLPRGVAQAQPAALRQLPLGWDGESWASLWGGSARGGVLDRLGAAARRWMGLLLTLVAVAGGAPVWFDILQRLVRVRAAGAWRKLEARAD